MASVEEPSEKKEETESDENDTTIKKLETKITELQRIIVTLKQEKRDHKPQYESDVIDEILDEVEQNEEKYHAADKKGDDTLGDEEEEDKTKPAQFWTDLEKKLKDGDVDHIKRMVRNKELKMDEVDSNGSTLLMIAACYGSFELVSMAINLGADIDKEDNKKQTALKIAKQNGYPDIEEILIMNQLKTELGERIENTTKDISRKQGVTANFMRILNDIFATTPPDEEQKAQPSPKRNAMSHRFLSKLAQALSEELLETLLNIMICSIEQKVAYSNDLLHIAFHYEVYIQKRAPRHTLLYETIKHCVLNILKDTKNKKDWYWLKDYILNASIWYFRVDPHDDKSQYLWYEIFEWVQNQTVQQSKELSKPMRRIENSNTAEWNKLIHYTIENKAQTVPRQDEIERGLKSEYTKEYLTQNVSLSGSFNPFVHYDLSQYLTKLVLICHEADDRFQNDVQEIFGINKETKQNKELKLLYMRGPVKKYERCYAKVMGSYRDQRFPTAAHILDIVRCSFVFGDVSSMLCGMDLFRKKIADTRSNRYCIAEIVRIKNGFVEYSHNDASYTDIKLNVTIIGSEYNVVGEIQFLVKDMFDYKKIAHSLYSIERTKEFADGLSQVLPLKLNLEKQLFIHAARNDINGLTDLMVAHNFAEEELLQLNQRNQSILTPLCALNCEKVFNYLVKEIPHTLLRERLIFPDHTKAYPLLKAIQSNHYHGVLQTIFKDDAFNLIHYKDQNQQMPIDLCWTHKKGKCALLILQSVQSEKERLKLIDYTGAETTALQNALLSGELEVVSFILQQLDTPLKAKLLRNMDSKQQSNWHYVAQGGSVECLQLLLKHCEQEEDSKSLTKQLWNSEDAQRTTPLYHAVTNAKAEMTDFLLGQLNAKEKAMFFETPSLYGKMAIDELMSSKTKEHFDTLKVVVRHLAPNDKHLGKLFLIAAQNDELELAQLLLSRSTEDRYKREMVLNYQNSTMECPLSECCIHNNTAFLKYLLKELGDDYASFVFKSSTGRCALMEAASKCHVKACRLILNKISKKEKILKTVLSMKDATQQTALVLAINATNKNNEKCAKLILRHYDLKSDSEDIFLACLQLSDIEMAQAIWNNTNGDRQLQNKLLRITDKEEYNCFLLVCKNGNYECLAWLLTLNDHLANEKQQDEKNLMQKHQSSGQTPLLLCIANDKRKKCVTDEEKKQKVLTKKQQESYFKCTTLIFDKVSHAHHLIFDKDNKHKNALHYACENGNAQTVGLLLSKLSDKDQNKIIDENDVNRHNAFVGAVSGGALELVQTMYALYRKYDKVKALTQNSIALKVALTNGYEEIAEWILFELMKDARQKLKYLNANIVHSKSGRRFEEKIKTWITKILEREVKMVHNVRDVVHIFAWVLQHPPIDQFCVKLILDKIAKDEYSKSTFIKESRAISESCQRNLFEVLQGLLSYLEAFTTPLFQGTKNALMEAIDARSNKCVEWILNSIKDKSIKNRLIEACNTDNANALMRAIDIKSESMIQLIFKHHSDIQCILGDAFIHGLKKSNADLAKYILDKANDRSKILNHTYQWGRTALNAASSQKTSDCLKLIVAELKRDLEQQTTAEEEEEKETDGIHPMYIATTHAGRNVFHWMFTTECTLENIRILESILPQKIIRRLLLSRCTQGSFFPIHYAIEKSPMEVVKWLISQFDDDPLQQFNMLTQRTEYDASLVAFGIRDKAIKKYLSDTLIKCMKQIDLKQIDIMIIKDILYYTTGWKHVELQQLIMDNAAEETLPYLFNKDDILHHWGHLWHEVIRTDDEAIGQLFISKTTDIKSLMVRDNYGLYVMARGMLQGSIKVMKLILERLKPHQELLMQQIRGYDRSSYKGFFYAWNYNRIQCAMQVVSYLKEEHIHVALNEACKHDKELTIIPALLDVVSSERMKETLLCQQNEKGQNTLHVALNYNMRKVVEFLTKTFPNDIEDGAESLFITTDWSTNSTPIASIAAKTDSYSDILDTILHRLSPNARFNELLRRNFRRETVLSCVKGKKDMERVCNTVLCQLLQPMEVMADVDILFQLFVFCCESNNLQTLNIILSKTAAHVKHKLFMNYDEDRNWNMMKALINTDKEKKEMLFALLESMDSKSKHFVLNDATNPNHLRKNALIHCIQTADMECYNAIVSEYAEHKEDCNALLTRYDENHKTALYFAVKSHKEDIAMDILQRIKENEAEVMRILNTQTTDDDSNVFDIVTSSKLKNALKKLISHQILANVKQNSLSPDAFFPYFKWLCKNNEIDDVKALINTFMRNDKDYVYKLLKYTSGATRKGALHTASTNNYYELLKYLISFIETDRQKEEYLLLEDAHGNNALLLSCASDASECSELLIKCMAPNQTLLSQMLLCENSEHKTSIEYEMIKAKMDDLQLMLQCTSDPLIVQRLFIAAIKHCKNEFAESVLQKAQSLNIIKMKQIFDYTDKAGHIALYEALSTGNTKFAQIILNEIDKDDKATIDYLVEYTTYLGHSLLAAACHSTNINAAKLIMTMFQFQKSRNHLLFGTDAGGNNPLQIYFIATGTDYKCAEISEFVLWYLSNIKTNKEKLALLSHCNLANVSTFDYDLIKSNAFGSFLFKRIVSSMDCSTEQDIPSWAKILEVAIKIKHNTLSVVQCVIHKYANHNDHILKLLSCNNHASQNAFYNVSANGQSRSVLKYLTQFVNQNNNHLLIEPDLDGNTSLHKVITDVIRGGMILKKFNLRKNSDVLFIKNDNNLSILDKAQSCAATLILSKQINTAQLVELFMNNVTDQKLFCFFLDHEEELMPKLLWKRCASNHSTWLMEVIWMSASNTARYLFKWTVDWVRKLSKDDQMKLLSQRNIRGQTALHYAAFFDDPEVIQTILSLYTSQESKEIALLAQTHEGITPFHRSYASIKPCSAHMIWQNITKVSRRLRIMNPMCKFWRNTIDTKGIVASHNWKERIRKLLTIEMKGEYITAADDIIQVLIPLFYFAVVANDIEFAQCVVSKINPQDTECVVRFVTTQIPSMNDENCLHFAAYSKQSGFMSILVDMIGGIGARDQYHTYCGIGNKYQETPLSIACKKGHFYVLKYISSAIGSDERLQWMKLIEMVWKYEIPKTKEHYKTKAEYQIGLNCIATCCLFKRLECLKQLLSTRDHDDIQKSMIAWRNTKKQSIYHFIKDMKTCTYLTQHFTFETTGFNEKDVDGMTPFMELIKSSAKLQFIEWILDQCENEKEKLRFIYNVNEKGENALELAGAGSVRQLFLIRTIKTYLKLPLHRTKKDGYKAIDMMIPIFLDSLRTGNIDLTQWLLSLLRKDGDIKRLMNSEYTNGLNAVLSACKGGQTGALQFVLSHPLLDALQVFKGDENGLTPIHYACHKNSISCLSTILSLYKEKGRDYDMEEVMFMTDTRGNTPFDYIIRESALSFLFKWIIRNFRREPTAKRKRIEMLFGNKNKKNQVALVELMLRQSGTDALIVKCIKEYFDEIEAPLSQQDVEIVGYVLMYLHKDNWSVCKSIVAKIKDEQILFDVLNVENSDKYNVLLYACKYSPHYIVNWWIGIIPNDHPILFKKETVTHKSAIAMLMDRSLLTTADSVLNKISDTKQRRFLLTKTKDSDNKTILDDAKQQNIPNRIQWIQKYI